MEKYQELLVETARGKSTIFRMILNLIEPTEGEIKFNGTNIDTKIGQSKSGICAATVSGSKEKIMNQHILYI